MEDRVFYLKLLIDYWLEFNNKYQANMWYTELLDKFGIEYKKIECEV